MEDGSADSSLWSKSDSQILGNSVHRDLQTLNANLKGTKTEETIRGNFQSKISHVYNNSNTNEPEFRFTAEQLKLNERYIVIKKIGKT